MPKNFSQNILFQSDAATIGEFLVQQKNKIRYFSKFFPK
jgi:hypothetical protein